MRDFSWKYFTLTGDVESFMLYNDMNRLSASEQMDEISAAEDEWAATEDEAYGSYLNH